MLPSHVVGRVGAKVIVSHGPISFGFVHNPLEEKFNNMGLKLFQKIDTNVYHFVGVCDWFCSGMGLFWQGMCYPGMGHWGDVCPWCGGCW